MSSSPVVNLDSGDKWSHWYVTVWEWLPCSHRPPSGKSIWFQIPLCALFIMKCGKVKFPSFFHVSDFFEQCLWSEFSLHLALSHVYYFFFPFFFRLTKHFLIFFPSSIPTSQCLILESCPVFLRMWVPSNASSYVVWAIFSHLALYILCTCLVFTSILGQQPDKVTHLSS